MAHAGEHAARCRRIRELGHTAYAIEAEPDQRRAPAAAIAANGTSGLLKLDLVGHRS
jgi:hypothetical protein